MPPKIFKRQTVLPRQSAPSSSKEEIVKPSPTMININSLAHNFTVLSRMRTLLALLIGAVCGIINCNQIVAPIAYIVIQLAATLVFGLAIGNYRRCFNSLTEVAAGIPESLMMFICSWMLSYNLVYTL